MTVNVLKKFLVMKFAIPSTHQVIRQFEGWRMVFASIREHAEHCDFFASTSRKKKIALRACEQRKKLGEHEQASTRLNFASKSSKGKILRAVKNFNGPFIYHP